MPVPQRWGTFLNVGLGVVACMDNHVGAPKEQVAVQAEEGEAARGLLKRAKLADISIDVLHVETPIL